MRLFIILNWAFSNLAIFVVRIYYLFKKKKTKENKGIAV